MATTKQNIYGNRLKQQIKEKGFTQEQYAQLIGIGLTQLKDCLNGKKEFYSLPYEVLIRMAKVLEVDVGYILGISIFPQCNRNTLYGAIKNIKDIDICCNPENENEVRLSYNNMEWYTDMDTLENKIMRFLRYNIISENEE